MTLVLGWVDARSARYACERWHYSRSTPAGRVVRFGIWEDERFIGVVLFGRGAAPHIGRAIGLHLTETCELVRVALRDHEASVTRMVAIALRLLHRHSPDLRAVVSFADEAHGHTGRIYQAGNWIYLGAVVTHVYEVRGVPVHPKTLHSRYGIGGQSIPWLREHVDQTARRIVLPPKHKYVYAFDKETRERFQTIALPYPRAADPTGEASLPAASRRFDSDPAAL